MSSCIVLHLFCLFFYRHYYFLFLLCCIKLCLSQPYEFYSFFLILFLIPSREWVRGCGVLSVLVSAEIELISLLVSWTGLCFGFNMKMMLATNWCFGCCQVVLTFSQGLFSFPCSATEEVHKEPGAWPGQLTQTDQRDMLSTLFLSQTQNIMSTIKKVNPIPARSSTSYHQIGVKKIPKLFQN